MLVKYCKYLEHKVIALLVKRHWDYTILLIQDKHGVNVLLN